ncbi:hypothetical protein EMM73_02470 [Rheinheimera sediminis]|uniref:hypothetical protein n=1 Tax=Rheinheimera sp. YQF-1 TaxID=2499626 RepID=UPI000FD9D3BF|nr:hypothetical protein [Rheinheimera sp. YQF-1]RVT48176.1 hypothetical protein EMM73_02470 [Rheinheimera sp. YQF-1]
MRYSNEEMENALAEINRNQKPVLAFIASLIGAVPAMGMYFFFAQMGGVLYLMLALPPAFVGLFARFVGRTYKAKHRISVGIVGALVHVAGCLLLQFNPLIYLLAPVAFFIAMSVAKIKLKHIHGLAIIQANLGKLSAEK